MEQLKMVEEAEEQRKFILQVYLWMTIALFTTAVIAFSIAGSDSLMEIFLGSRTMVWGILIAEIVLVLILSRFIEKMSSSVAIVCFFLYAVLNGITFSTIFLAYDLGSIASVFFITAGTFGVMCAYGYLTKKDLTSVGNICFMALIGLIIAGIANMFIMNNIFYMAISSAGVLIFVGLTAYDTQKIKNMSYYVTNKDNEELETKGSILGALTLYLDFINLFLYILRIFGKRR